jgi:hypothetical protein
VQRAIAAEEGAQVDTATASRLARSDKFLARAKEYFAGRPGGEDGAVEVGEVGQDEEVEEEEDDVQVPEEFKGCGCRGACARSCACKSGDVVCGPQCSCGEKKCQNRRVGGMRKLSEAKRAAAAAPTADFQPVLSIETLTKMYEEEGALMDAEGRTGGPGRKKGGAAVPEVKAPSKKTAEAIGMGDRIISADAFARHHAKTVDEYVASMLRSLGHWCNDHPSMHGHCGGGCPLKRYYPAVYGAPAEAAEPAGVVSVALDDAMRQMTEFRLVRSESFIRQLCRLIRRMASKVDPACGNLTTNHSEAAHAWIAHAVPKSLFLRNSYQMHVAIAILTFMRGPAWSIPVRRGLGIETGVGTQFQLERESFLRQRRLIKRRTVSERKKRAAGELRTKQHATSQNKVNSAAYAKERILLNNLSVSLGEGGLSNLSSNSLALSLQFCHLAGLRLAEEDDGGEEGEGAGAGAGAGAKRKRGGGARAGGAKRRRAEEEDDMEEEEEEGAVLEGTHTIEEVRGHEWRASKGKGKAGKELWFKVRWGHEEGNKDGNDWTPWSLCYNEEGVQPVVYTYVNSVLCEDELALIFV